MSPWKHTRHPLNKEAIAPLQPVCHLLLMDKGETRCWYKSDRRQWVVSCRNHTVHPNEDKQIQSAFDPITLEESRCPRFRRCCQFDMFNQGQRVSPGIGTRPLNAGTKQVIKNDSLIFRKKSTHPPNSARFLPCRKRTQPTVCIPDVISRKSC